MAMLQIAIWSFWQYRGHIVMHEKAKCVYFNYMQPQKVKFKSVQINMKHVSYKELIYVKSIVTLECLMKASLASAYRT